MAGDTKGWLLVWKSLPKDRLAGGLVRVLVVDRGSNQIWRYIRFIRVVAEGIINYTEASSTPILGKRCGVGTLTCYGYS